VGAPLGAWLRSLLADPAVSAIDGCNEDFIICTKIGPNNLIRKKEKKVKKVRNKQLKGTDMHNCFAHLLVILEPMNCLGAFPSPITCIVLHKIELGGQLLLFCLLGLQPSEGNHHMKWVWLVNPGGRDRRCLQINEKSSTSLRTHSTLSMETANAGVMTSSLLSPLSAPCNFKTQLQEKALAAPWSEGVGVLLLKINDNGHE
jgi:hypothetical protein